MGTSPNFQGVPTVGQPNQTNTKKIRLHLTKKSCLIKDGFTLGVCVAGQGAGFGWGGAGYGGEQVCLFNNQEHEENTRSPPHARWRTLAPSTRAETAT